MKSRNGSSAPAAHIPTLVSALTLFLALAAPASAQSPNTPSERTETTEVIRLTSTAQNNASNDLSTALRNALGPHVRVSIDSTQNAIVVHGTAEEIEQAHKVISELDHPLALYKLTYTITRTENGAPAGTQHYALLAAANQRTEFKEGLRVPLITGKSADNASSEAQVQYIDIGLSITATLEGSSLHSKVEESAIADEKSPVSVQDPVIRQVTLQSGTTFTPGKPILLGSLDIANSTRHQEVQVLIERVQ